MSSSQILCSLIVLLPLSGLANTLPQGYRRRRHMYPRQPRLPAASHARLSRLNEDGELPKDFDWRNVSGQSLVRGVTPGMAADLAPRDCGDCYIYATLTSLEDRIKVMRRGAFPDVMLSRQVVLNCLPPKADGQTYGCNGGDPWVIHEYLHNNSIPDSTCQPYFAQAMECTAVNTCRACFTRDNPRNTSNESEAKKPWAPGLDCVEVARKEWIGYGVSDYGEVSGEQEMMKEIYAGGPITCAMIADDEMFEFYSKNNSDAHEGVYVPRTGNHTYDKVDHSIEVTGWGETESGIKYWVLRNSWGTPWGDMGWLKLQRGVNALMIEEECDWSVPDFSELTEHLAGAKTHRLREAHGNLRGS